MPRAPRAPLACAVALALTATVGALADPPAPAAARRDPDPDARLLSAWKDGELVVPRGLPAPWVPPSNPPTDAKIALGRRLFFEKALSRDRSRSCAHCHDPALALGDARRTALGVRDQIGPRNVPSLINAAIAPVLFWDGRAVSLEAQAEGPLLAVTELDMTEDLLVARIEEGAAYRPLFEQAFGSPTITLRRAAQALACFERTLLAADSPFDRWWFGKDASAMDAAQQRGYEIFRTKGGCAGCHSIRPAEAALSDFEFHATGAGAKDDADLGRFVVTGRAEDKRRFRTPSLRNVAATGPYFHDGSAATLEAVVDHYDRGGATIAGVAPEIAPLHLSPAEKSDLVAFLGALSSPGVVCAPPPPVAPTLVERARAPGSNPRAIRSEASDRLEANAADLEAATALLVASTRLAEPETLDDAIERTKALAPKDRGLARERGIALVRRARFDTPANATMLREAADALSAEAGPTGDVAAALELAYARHLLGDAPGAEAAYERVLNGPDEELADRALAGIRSLVGGTEEAFAARLSTLPDVSAVVRARADRIEAKEGVAAALKVLEEWVPGEEMAFPPDKKYVPSPRVGVATARRLRMVERHADALHYERIALKDGARDLAVVDGVEALWREHRPLASFSDCDALDADFRLLFDAVKGDAWRSSAYRNDLAFRFREIASAYAYRAEGRTQRLAEGAPGAARGLLARCVALYEEAVALIPKDALDLPFEERWSYAALLNDAALMRHYWLDVRDLAKAEAGYLRAFELTDGAYMDTYFYNLQYLYGFELPGNEAKWYALARRAAERILKPGPQGLVPDEMKREAARRDAEALARVLAARPRPDGGQPVAPPK